MMTTSRRTLVLLAAVCLVMSAAVRASQQSRDAAKIVATGTAEIAGTLVTDDTAATPVRRATMTLTGTLGVPPLVAVTDDAGSFAFRSLPAGRYALSASKGGYLPSTYGGKRPGGAGTAIVVEDGQRVANLAVTLLKGSVLSGMVLDEGGRPAPNVKVAVLRYTVSYLTGERALQPARFGSSQVTDDRGMYRVYGLEPGEYFVSASSSVRPNANARDVADIHQITDADIRRAQQLLRGSGGMPATQPVQDEGARPTGPTVNYAPVYYPAALAAADAAPIALGPHEERGGIDIQLRMVPTARVEGVTVGPDGVPLAGVGLVMMDPGPLPEGVLRSALRNAESDRQGRFVLPGISPGRYTIEASGAPGQVSRAGGGDVPASAVWGLAELSVDGHDVATSIVMAPGVTVSGRMVFEGALAPPNPTTISPILLGSRMGGYGLRVDPTGAFTFLSVAPGRYRIAINRGAPAGWMLKSAMLSGVDVSDIPIEITPNENVEGAVITFTDRRTEISGTMQDATGKPAPEYVLIVFSADKRFWVPQTRRTQQVRPGADGRFIVRDLPPGDYLIGALTDVESGQWNDPAFLAELAANRPIKITLADGEKKIQDIRVGGG